MNHSLTGKTAIVTGAAIGIGFGIARHLLELGSTLVLNDLDPTACDEAVERLRQEFPDARVHPCAGDAGNVAFVRELTDFAARLPDSRLHIAVANAGLTEFGKFLEFTEESFARVVNLNLRGTFFLAQSVARHLVADGEGGRIIIIGSNVGQRAYPDLAAYGMSKGGLAQLVRHLSYDLGGHGITVNLVAPGAVLTERTEREEPDYAGIWARINPTGRVGHPGDVAAAVGYLVSEAAGHVTGQELYVDGGWGAYAPSPAFVADLLADGKD